MKKEFPKITLVLPSFNKVDFVEQSIRSALDQNYPNLELIVMDGGSTDGSVDILERYKDKVTHFESKKDKGDWEALNNGFNMATGDIYAVLNADDMLMPNSLFMVAEIFSAHSDIQWITGKPVGFDGEGFIRDVKNHKPLTKERFYFGTMTGIQLESTFWRKELWEAAGGHFDSSFNPAHDYELWTRFFQHANLYRVETLLGGFRRYSTTKQHSRAQKEKYMSLAKKGRHAQRSGYGKYLVFQCIRLLSGIMPTTNMSQKVMRKLYRLVFRKPFGSVVYSFDKQEWIVF